MSELTPGARTTELIHAIMNDVELYMTFWNLATCTPGVATGSARGAVAEEYRSHILAKLRTLDAHLASDGT